MSRFLLLLALAVSMTVLGCSEDTPTDPGGDSSNSLTVNGNGYSNLNVPIMTDNTFSFAGEEVDDDTQMVNGMVLLQGIVGDPDGDGDLFMLSIVVDDVGTGTFQVNQTEGVAVALSVIKTDTQELYFANSGTVKIDEWGGVGGTARGSFEVTAVVTPSMDKEITIKGKFDLSPIRE